MKLKNWGILIIIIIYSILVIGTWNDGILLSFIILICVMAYNQVAYKIKDGIFFMAIFIRRTIYLVPYIVAYIIYSTYNTGFNQTMEFRSNNILIYCFLSIIIALLFLSIRINDFKVLFNKEIMELSPLTIKQILLNIYSNVGSAISEELFYKGVVFFVLYKYGFGLIVSSIITSLSFMSIHKTQRYSNKLYTAKDYCIQFLFSFIGCIFYLLSGFIAIPIVMHVTYNLPLVVNDLLKCKFTTIKNT